MSAIRPVWLLGLLALLSIMPVACLARPTSLSQAQPAATPVPVPALSPTPLTYITRHPTPSPPAPAVAPTESNLPQPYRGIWLTRSELAVLPTAGPAWQNVLAGAAEETDRPRIENQDDGTDVHVLAKALVYARTGEAQYRVEVVDAIEEAIGSERGGRTLALGRNLVGYVLAADLINLPADPEVDEPFREWLRFLLTVELDDRTLISTHEERPNNWGTHAGAARVAIALYLGDDFELAQAARVFEGYLGDRQAYTGFEYGALWWQADPLHPVGINPAGAMRDGYVIDGALPEEMRRGGPFAWPPSETGYAWEALQGAIVQAQLLYRAGYDSWAWEEQALRRATQFLYAIGWSPTADDEWQPWLINFAYGTDFAAVTPARPGKNMGWTDWTHGPPSTAEQPLAPGQ